MTKKNKVSAIAKISLTKASNDIDGISTLVVNLAEPPSGSEFGARSLARHAATRRAQRDFGERLGRAVEPLGASRC